MCGGFAAGLDFSAAAAIVGVRRPVAAGAIHMETFMPRTPFIKLAVLALLATPAAAAADWQSGVATNGNSAWAIVEAGGKQFRIDCNRGDASLFVKLLGGPFPGMKNQDDESDSAMLWIEAGDGRTARHPLDGHYFDTIFLARWPTSDLVLDQFAKGARMQVTAVSGDVAFETAMTGTSKARAAMAAGCGL